MPLTLDAVLPDYKASLHDAASVFVGTKAGPGGDPAADPDADFKRHLAIAARALGIDGKRSCTRLGTLNLVAGAAQYAAVPDDLIAPKASEWGIGRLPLWEAPPGPLPIVRLTELDGAPVLMLSPAPTQAQINAYGSSYAYYYLATPTLTATGSTLRDGDRDLLILRAQVEACREMVLRNMHKPVAIGAGQSPGAPNLSAAAMYDRLLAEYRAAA